MNGKMFRGQLGSYAESDSGRSSQGSTWREKWQKRRKDREYEEGQSGLGEGSFQTYRMVFDASECNRSDKRNEEHERRDEEHECLHRLVRDLELEGRGRRRRRDHEEREKGSTSVGGRYGARSHQSGSHRHWDHSWEYADRDSISPEERRPQNVAMDTMSSTFHRAARSPFSRNIEHAPMLSRFTQPSFNSYDGKTDLVKHVSHYI